MLNFLMCDGLMPNLFIGVAGFVLQIICSSQAERYDDMAASMKAVTEAGAELSNEVVFWLQLLMAQSVQSALSGEESALGCL